MWDFDNYIISVIQYFHTQHSTGYQKIIGYFIAFLALIVNFLFAYEVWMIITLGLTLYLQDEPAAKLNIYVLLNILVV